MRVPFTLSNESITVFAGGKMHTVLSGHKNFDLLREHLKGSEHDVAKIIKWSDREEGIRQSSIGSKVEIKAGVVYYEGQEINNTLTNKLLDLMDEGFAVGPWVKFLENLMLNPSYRSRECLFGFLEKFNAPITADGNFIAFKRVGSNFKDLHTGTIDNSVGTVVQMDRSKVDDDPQHTCSSGLHVCADEYLKDYANSGSARTLVVEVNPANVVAVPYDYNFSKMRVCEYKVLAEIDPKEIPDILEEETYGDWDEYDDDIYNEYDDDIYNEYDDGYEDDDCCDNCGDRK